jgi:hypothetical protein
MKEKHKSAFLFHYDLKSKIDMLSDEIAGQVIKAAFDYAINGIVPNNADLGFRMVFSDIKDDIDADSLNYNERCEKNRQAIQKRWDEYKRIQTNTNEYECKKTDTKHTDSDNDSDSDSDSDSEYKKEIISKDIKEKQVFQTPTLSEIKDYILEKHYQVDAERFFDFYSSKGWMIGKNKMKDWKAAIRTWSRSDRQQQPKSDATANICTHFSGDYSEKF